MRSPLHLHRVERVVSDRPDHTGYDVHLWFLGNASANLPADEGRFGVRVGTQDLASQTFGASTGYVHPEVSVTVPAGVHEVTVYAGFNASGVDTWIQPDDFTVS